VAVVPVGRNFGIPKAHKNMHVFFHAILDELAAAGWRADSAYCVSRPSHSSSITEADGSIIVDDGDRTSFAHYKVTEDSWVSIEILKYSKNNKPLEDVIYVRLFGRMGSVEYHTAKFVKPLALHLDDPDMFKKLDEYLANNKTIRWSKQKTIRDGDCEYWKT